MNTTNDRFYLIIYKNNDYLKIDLSVYSCNADIQCGDPYKMGKDGGFCQLFYLACTVSAGVVCGKDTSGNKYQAFE